MMTRGDTEVLMRVHWLYTPRTATLARMIDECTQLPQELRSMLLNCGYRTVADVLLLDPQGKVTGVGEKRGRIIHDWLVQLMKDATDDHRNLVDLRRVS